MKIGIVTQPLRDNYGGLLQNWALQQILIELGHKPITIDAYMRFPLWRYIRSICGWVFYNYFRKIKTTRRHRYKGRNSYKLTGKFVERNIAKTRPLDHYEDGIIDEYGIDCVVVGSDQVWRPMFNNDIGDMFLDFIKHRDLKKLVYAASFGTSDWEFSPMQSKKCASLVNQFNAVSVREASGVNLCQEHFGIKPVLVLDPTLLLKRDKYESLCKDVPRNEDSFIAVYCLDKSEEKMCLFRSIAKRFDLELRMFSADNDLKLTVPQWLAMFRDASIVVSDSFHGTVFSIIFQKQFYSIVNHWRGNARVTSLLEQLDLNSQIIDVNSTSYPSIDYSHVNERLASLRRESIQFLNEHLQ